MRTRRSRTDTFIILVMATRSVRLIARHFRFKIRSHSHFTPQVLLLLLAVFAAAVRGLRCGLSTRRGAVLGACSAAVATLRQRKVNKFGQQVAK